MWRNKKYKNHPKNKKNRNYLLLGPPSRFFDFSPKKIQKKKIQKKKTTTVVVFFSPQNPTLQIDFWVSSQTAKKKKKTQEIRILDKY